MTKNEKNLILSYFAIKEIKVDKIFWALNEFQEYQRKIMLTLPMIGKVTNWRGETYDDDRIKSPHEYAKENLEKVFKDYNLLKKADLGKTLLVIIIINQSKLGTITMILRNKKGEIIHHVYQ